MMGGLSRQDLEDMNVSFRDKKYDIKNINIIDLLSYTFCFLILVFIVLLLTSFTLLIIV